MLDASHEILSQRLLAFSREEVFAAFRDPARLAEWWGPAGFRNTFEEFELRAGGRWRSTMYGPGGQVYPIAKTFVEVVPPARVAFRHEQENHGFVMTMDFMAETGGTRLVWRMRFDSADECARVRAFVVEANEQNLDRLAAHLQKSAASVSKSGAPVR